MLDNEEALACWGLLHHGKKLTRLINCYAQLAIYVQLAENCEQFGVASECCAEHTQTLLDVRKHRDTWEGYAGENEV